MIDPRITEQIVQAWKDDENHINRARIKRSLPPVEVVHRFVEQAFFASLKQEEGKTIAFSAVLVSAEEARTEKYYKLGIHAIKRLMPFTASTIAKLAPAFDPALSALAVEANDQNEPVIWGVFCYSPPKHRYNEVPVGGIAGLFHRPDFLTVAAVAPGSLFFSRETSALGRITSGYFVRSVPTPFTHLSLGKYWDAFLQKTAPWLSNRIHYWHHARDAMEVLLDEVASRGHGGTLVVLDASVEPPAAFYRPNHEFSDDLELSEYLKQAAVVPSGTIGMACRKVAFEALQRVAQLAAIDGALILDSTFKVVTFGAKLSAPLWTKQTLIGPDSFGRPNGGIFDVTRYGTRHQSARDFAGACPAAIVFVISQDGPIRAFHRTDETTVTCWPDCSTSMFVY